MADARQLDLFVAFIGDVPLRDERESMSLPMVSLSKRKRVKPIEFTSADGKLWCKVSCNPLYGMATIYDFDIILWCISQLNEAVEKGLKTSPTLKFQPYDLLTAIGRDVGGRRYKQLEAALERLQSTSVTTSVRSDERSQKAMFSWLDSWQHEVDEATKRSRGMQVTVPRWLYDGIVKDRAVLAVSPEYFKLTGGLARWMYRLARRHGGKQAGGFRFSMRGLHQRSGSTQAYHQFARDVRKLVDANALPEYSLELFDGQKGDEMVAMWRDPTKVSVPQRRDLRRLS